MWNGPEFITSRGGDLQQLTIPSTEPGSFRRTSRRNEPEVRRIKPGSVLGIMEIFYTKLWSENLGKADALWQAKMALRSESHGPRDWAAWVLTGDPN